MYFVHFAAYPSVPVRYRGRIGTEIEECRGNVSATTKDEMVLDNPPHGPVEGRHERAVEEDPLSCHCDQKRCGRS